MNSIVFLVFLICFAGTVPMRKTKMVFKTSIRCTAAPKTWCFSFRFYETDHQRVNQYLSPEIYTCTDNRIHSFRLIGSQKYEGDNTEPLQVHFITRHNCSTLSENTWRLVDLHYKEVQVEPQHQKFRIRLDITDNGHIQKNLTFRDAFL